jgi:hypothetical protein
MIIRKTDGTHVQAVALSTWEIEIPEGRTNVELTGVFSEDGRSSIAHDSVSFVDGVLTIFFGLDTHTGTARYEYDGEGSGTETITTGSSNVNITVNQCPR